MDNFLKFIFKQKKFAIVFTLSIIIVGFLSLQEIRRDMFPAVDFEVLSIDTNNPGASPEDVEKNITNVVEEALQNIDGIDNFTSFSREGFSSVIVELSQDATNTNQIKSEIRTAMTGLTLPDEVENPKVMDWNTSQFPILQINIDANNYPYDEVRTIVDEMEKSILDVKGVASIVKRGHLDKELQIILNEDKLNQYQISVDQIINAIKFRNYRFTVGDNNDIENLKNIVILTEYENIADLENVVIRSVFDGPVIKLKDVANIVFAKESENTITRVNGTKGFSLEVNKKVEADVITTVDLVKEKTLELKDSYPQKINIFFTYDQSKEVRNRLEIVTKNGIFGLVLILIVLGIFLSFKTAFWVSVSLPVTLLGTVAMLSLFGQTINLLSLSAMILVLGIVVDDSIIIAESIYRYKTEGNNLYNSVIKGFKRVILPVITTILTTIIAMSTMFLMTGTMGKFVYIIPLVVIFALTFSFLEVSIALPAHLVGIKSEKKKFWLKPFENWFEKILVKFLSFRYFVVLFFIALFAFSTWFASNNMNFNLFPAQGSSIINGYIKASSGSSAQNTEKFIAQIEEIIKEQGADDIDYYTSSIGIWFPDESYITVSLIPPGDRKRSAQEITDAIQQEADKITEVTSQFSVLRPGPPIGASIDVNLISNNDQQRNAATNRVIEELNAIEGVANIQRNDKKGKARIETVLDFEAMSELGISYDQVYRHLRLIYSGIDVTNVNFGSEKNVVRIYLGDKNYSESFITETKILNNQGKLISMGEFADVKQIEGEADINHFNGDRANNITAEIGDGFIPPQEAIKIIKDNIDFNSEYPEVRFLENGATLETQTSIESFIKALLVSVFGIFLLIMLLFNSWSQPVLIILAIPFAFIGVIWAFYFHGQPLSFFTMLGSLALIGVIVNDSLVMVNHLNYRLKENKDKNIFVCIASAAKERLRAIILTSLTTLAGLLPLAYGIGGVDYLLQPMVLALGYGLLFGTFVNLILVPCMYSIHYSINNCFKARKEQIVLKLSKSKS